jgi:hypothetical protein
MEVSRIGRAVFALNVLVVVVGVVISVVKAGDSDLAFFSGAAAKLNVFCFFTIQSNLILAATCLLLAVGAASSATWFRVLRLIGVVGIALTFVVFQAVLRQLQDLTGLNALADFLLHTLSPILGVGGWLLFGPRRQTSVAVVWWTTAYVAAWGIVTMIRGAIVENAEGHHFYPYGFMDPTEHGYVRVIVNLVVVAIVFFALAFGAHALDRWLTRRRTPATHR